MMNWDNEEKVDDDDDDYDKTGSNIVTIFI